MQDGRRRGVALDRALLLALLATTGGGAGVLAVRAPSAAEIRMIVHETVAPLEARVRNLEVTLGRIDERIVNAAR